jgi:transposase InsO family protein
MVLSLLMIFPASLGYSFCRKAQNEFELKVKKIRSDNGSKFKNLQVEEYLEEEGVKHEFSAPYTPQQNGVVERKNRRLSTWRE